MWNRYKLVFELTEPILGTIPKDRNVFEKFVMSQARTEMEQTRATEDVDRVAEETESGGWTGFYENDKGHPILMDYQFKGFLKNAGNILKDSESLGKTTKKSKTTGNETTVKGIPSLRSHINDTVFVHPRFIELAEKPDSYLERPLRAQTAQGPRVTVMRSDQIDPGRQYELEIAILDNSKVSEKVLRVILSYGEVMGLLQWKNGGYGRFKVVSLEKK